MEIPLLVTMDLEIAQDHDLCEQADVLPKLINDLSNIQLPITVFTIAKAAVLFADQLNVIIENGHEIGCHGLNHLPSENYANMSIKDITSNIEEATKCLTSLTGSAPRSFRGPYMSTSVATQEILMQHQYLADFSVCPQRLDALTCAGWEKAWLTAPRNTYHASVNDPFRAGDSSLWVVPLSSIGVPFISGILYLFGLRFAKFMFKCLLFEAKLRGNPLVYLFHSYEFTQFNAKHIKQLPLHQRWYISNPELRYQQTLSLFRYMLSHKEIVPMTAQQYLSSIQR